jgi:hypothetical protein
VVDRCNLHGMWKDVAEARARQFEGFSASVGLATRLRGVGVVEVDNRMKWLVKSDNLSSQPLPACVSADCAFRIEDHGPHHLARLFAEW